MDVRRSTKLKKIKHKINIKDVLATSTAKKKKKSIDKWSQNLSKYIKY